jgi:integrase
MERLKPITEQQWLQCNEFNRNLRDEFINNSVELSDDSLKAYKSNLAIWFNWVRENLNNKKHVEVKSIEFKRYQNWLINLGHSSSDIANKRAAVSSLNNYILLYYEDDYPTFRQFINKGIKKPEKAFVNEKIPPTKAELQMMLDKLEESDIKDKYMKIAYLKFTFETGCRRSETMQIRKDIINAKPIVKTIKVKNEDGNEEEKEVKYYLTPKLRCKGQGKTGKIRQLKFSDYAMDAFKKWLEVRGDDDCEYMFVTKYKGEVKQVSRTTFNLWASDIFTPLLGRRFHPHILREARATSIVVEDGKNIEAAQRLLGHASSETTQIYVIKDDDSEESDELFVD